LGLSAATFAIPSIALFVFMLPITGLNKITAIAPLSLYMFSLLIRGVVDGILATDESVRQAAASMGYRATRRIFTVELPIATPVIIGTLRTAVVSNIGMVSITSVLGLPSLGDLFVDGTQRFFLTPDRKSTRLNSSHVSISYAVFCLKKKNNITFTHHHNH